MSQRFTLETRRTIVGKETRVKIAGLKYLFEIQQLLITRWKKNVEKPRAPIIGTHTLKTTTRIIDFGKSSRLPTNGPRVILHGRGGLLRAARRPHVPGGRGGVVEGSSRPVGATICQRLTLAHNTIILMIITTSHYNIVTLYCVNNVLVYYYCARAASALNL